MSRKADTKLLDLAIDYIQGTYKFEDVLKELNLSEGAESEGYNKLIMPCPFHGQDNTPSLKIDIGLNKFNCLSCGAGGRIVHFYLWHKLKVRNEKTNYYLVVDELLKKDPIMQLRVGAKTIMKNERFDTTGLDKISLKRSISFKREMPSPETFINLSRRLRQEYPNNTQLYLVAIGLMESGLKPNEIYDLAKDLLKDQKLTSRLSSTNLDSLSGGGFFD